MLSLYTGIIDCYTNWFEALFAQEINDQIRSKAFMIWVVSLYDIAESQDRMREIRNHVNHYALPSSLEMMDVCENIKDSVYNFFTGLNKQEQLFIRVYRDQQVHSWATNTAYSRDGTGMASVKWIEGWTMHRNQRMGIQELYDEIRPVQNGNLDQTILSLMAKSFHPPCELLQILSIEMKARDSRKDACNTETRQRLETT